MTATGASEGDDQVGAAALAVMRNRGREGSLEVVQELLRRRLADDEVPHAGIAPVERAELLDPVRVFEEPDVHHPGRSIRDAVLVTKRNAGQEKALARPELLGELSQLCDVDAVMGALVAAAGPPVGRADVHQHVTDVLRVGVFQDRNGVAAQRQDGIGLVPRGEPARELKPRVEKDADRFVQLRLAGAAHDDQGHGRNLCVTAILSNVWPTAQARQA